MFGYVSAKKEELRLREFEAYRAVYCGLCRQMGKCTGQCSRMTLSYDFVFLAAVRMALTGEVPAVGRVRCPVHPVRLRPAVEENAALTYAANAAAILNYHKLLDDKADETGTRRFRSATVRGMIRGGYRKAKKKYPDLDREIGERLSALGAWEKDAHDSPSADIPAAMFGKVMARVFSEGLSDGAARVASSLGDAVGRWIYYADAVDDFAEDRKRGRFNPLRPVIGEFPDAGAWEEIGLSMTAILCDAERAYLLIGRAPTPELGAILENVLYLGLPAAACRVLNKAKEEAGEPKSERKEF